MIHFIKNFEILQQSCKALTNFLVWVDIICHRMGARLNVCDLLGLHLLLKGVTPIIQCYSTMGYIIDERLCLGVLLRYATCNSLGFCCSKKTNRNWH